MSLLEVIPHDVFKDKLLDGFLGSAVVPLSETCSLAHELVKDELRDYRERSIIQCAEFVAQMEIRSPSKDNVEPPSLAFCFFNNLIGMQTKFVENRKVYKSEQSMRTSALERCLKQGRFKELQRVEIRKLLSSHPFAGELIQLFLEYEYVIIDDLFTLEVAAANGEPALFKNVMNELQTKNLFKQTNSDIISHELAPTNIERVLYQSAKSRQMEIITFLVTMGINSNGPVAQLFTEGDFTGLYHLWKCGAPIRFQAALYGSIGNAVGCIVRGLEKVLHLERAK